MKNFFKRYQIVIGLAFLAVVLVLLQFFYKGEEERKLGVAGVSPDPEEEVVERRNFSFKVIFSKDIVGVYPKMKFKVEPEIDFEKSMIEADKVEIKVKGYLRPGVKHTWTVTMGGETVGEWEYKDASATKEEKKAMGKGDPEAPRRILEEQYEKYPLIEYMPYSNEDFSMNYVGPLKLLVKIKGAEREAIKQQVKYWVESKGVSAKTHQFEWVVEEKAGVEDF